MVQEVGLWRFGYGFFFRILIFCIHILDWVLTWITWNKIMGVILLIHRWVEKIFPLLCVYVWWVGGKVCLSYNCKMIAILEMQDLFEGSEFHDQKIQIEFGAKNIFKSKRYLSCVKLSSNVELHIKCSPHHIYWKIMTKLVHEGLTVKDIFSDSTVVVFFQIK